MYIYLAYFHIIASKLKGKRSFGKKKESLMVENGVFRDVINAVNN